MSRRRKLRSDEEELWSRVASTATPLQPRKPALQLDETARVRPGLTPAQATEPAAPKPVPRFKVGEKARTDARIPDAPRTSVTMDAKAYRKLTRGKLKPEARLDLHGMTLDRAHPALIRFIVGSHAQGKRLVLVITGKGEGPGPRGPLPYQRGILRRQVPHWLAQAPLGPLVLQTAPAGRRHGGEGALYVYLRRQR